MALCFSIKSRDKHRKVYITDDVEILDKMAETSQRLAAALRVLFGDTELGEWRTVSCSELKSSIDTILEVVRQSGKSTATHYSIKVQDAPGFPYSRARGVGFWTDSGIYTIVTGIEKCDLIQMLPDGLGGAKEGPRRDIRDLKSFEAGNFGKIFIVKSRRPSGIVNALKRLQTFLDELDPTGEVCTAVG